VLYGFVAPLHQMREAREGKKKAPKLLLKSSFAICMSFGWPHSKDMQPFFLIQGNSSNKLKAPNLNNLIGQISLLFIYYYFFHL
jgi:hypothetical protein